MAVNLCKTDLGTGSGAARYPLLADGKDLLIIKHPSAWSNTKTMLATPDAEYFYQAVAWGEQTSYRTYIQFNSDTYADDPQTLLTQLETKRNAATTSSWIEGHRPLFVYWARSYPPYRMKTDPNINGTTLGNTMEIGTCWRCLRFNFKALPVGLLHTFSASWRVWNPSCLADTDMRYSPIDARPDVTHSVMAIKSLYRGAGVMRYKFSSEMQPPSYHQGTGYGEADIAANANGNLAHRAEAGSYCLLYDPWNSHSGVASASTSPNHYNYYNTGDLHVRIFAPHDNNGDLTRAPYFADIPITGDGLTSLRNALKSRGPIWAHCGFPTVESMCGWTDPGQNGLPGLEHWGQEPFQTVFLYCSRLELVIKATWPTKFNYT